MITGSNGQIFAAVVNYMGSEEIDAADPSYAGLNEATSVDQGADLWAGARNLGGVAWASSEVVGEVHITKGGGAVLTRTTVVTAGAASQTVRQNASPSSRVE